MGKGDKKSKKGKLWRGSYGNLRNRKAIRARINKAEASRKTKPESVIEAKPKKTTRKKSAS